MSIARKSIKQLVNKALNQWDSYHLETDSDVVYIGSTSETLTSRLADYDAVRTLTLSGDVTGTVTFSSTGNITVTTAVANDSHSHSLTTLSGAEANRVVVTNASKGLELSNVTATELSYLSGVTSAIQTQLNAKSVVTASDSNGKIKVNGTDVSVYVHPADSGNKHLPSGGVANNILRWSADGTGTWGAETPLSEGTTTGTGNAITDISFDGHTINIAKGSTFLTAHPATDIVPDTTDTGSATFGGTISVVDSVNRDAFGHVKGINVRTITLPTETALGLGTAEGSGNVLTAIKVSGHTITMVRGDSFVTEDDFNAFKEQLGNAMVFMGSLGTGGTIADLPAASKSNVGYTYKVITAGTYQTIVASVGDTFTCAKSGSGYAWVLIPSGDEPNGTVTSVTIKGGTGISIDSESAITTSGTRTISLAASGVTAGTYGPESDPSPTDAGTFTVPCVVVDSYGRVTSASNRTVTLPTGNNVTQTARTTNGNFPVLLRGTSAGTSTTTTTTSFVTSVLVNPSTGLLGATDLKLARATSNVPDIRWASSASEAAPTNQVAGDIWMQRLA